MAPGGPRSVGPWALPSSGPAWRLLLVTLHRDLRLLLVEAGCLPPRCGGPWRLARPWAQSPRSANAHRRRGLDGLPSGLCSSLRSRRGHLLRGHLGGKRPRSADRRHFTKLRARGDPRVPGWPPSSLGTESHTRAPGTLCPRGARPKLALPHPPKPRPPRRAFALETIRRSVSSPHFVTVLVLTLRCPPASNASASRRDPGPAGAPRSDAADPQAQTTYPESAGREPPAGPSASTGHTLPGRPARTQTSAPPGGLTRPLMPELLATAATRPGEACSAEDAPTSWGQTEAPTGTRSGEAGFERDCGLASQSQRGQCE